MVLLLLLESTLRRQNESPGFGGFGCFTVIVLVGLVLFFVLRGRKDRPEKLGASKRAMGSGPIADHTFASPYAKCPSCSASGDRMKQQWDGLRKVTWTCGYCGNVAGVQELKDEELPPSARQRLGLDPAARPGLRRGWDGPGPGGSGLGGSGMGGLLTGMMIGGMLGGNRHRDDDWRGPSGDGNEDGDWNDAGSGSDSDGSWGDSGDSDSGGDW